MVESSEATFSALQGNIHLSIPIFPFHHPQMWHAPYFVSVSVGAVALAIRTLSNKSAGGPDGLRSKHLKDMANSSNGVDSPFLKALAAFSTIVQEGKVSPHIRLCFFGATLITLEKKGGGVRPIAVGGTLSRLVGKIAESSQRIW